MWNVNAHSLLLNEVLSIYTKLFPGMDEIPTYRIPDYVRIGHLKVYAIFMGGVLAGAAMVCKHSLEYLFVSPSITTRGIGSFLFRGIVEKFRHIGYSKLLLECTSNLIGYYHRFGAYTTGTSKIYNNKELYFQMKVDIAVQ